MREAVTRQRFRELPDRRYMEREILPWLARESGPHLLSIGCRSYTVHYEAMLKRKGVRYSTADIDPYRVESMSGRPGADGPPELQPVAEPRHRQQMNMTGKKKISPSVQNPKLRPHCKKKIGIHIYSDRVKYLNLISFHL